MRSHFLPILLVAVGTASAQDPAPKPPAGDPPKVETPKPAETKVLAVGEKLPAGLSLRGIDGKVYELDSLRHRNGKGGKVLVLHFWSTTCPYEVAAEPKVNALTDEFRDQGVVVFGVAANAGEIGDKPAEDAFDTKDEAKLPYAPLRKKAKESKVNRAILVDHGGDTLGKLLDAKTTPHCYVIDADGVLRYSGALDDDPQGKKEDVTRYVANAVLALLAGEEPALKTTKPYG